MHRSRSGQSQREVFSFDSVTHTEIPYSECRESVVDSRLPLMVHLLYLGGRRFNSTCLQIFGINSEAVPLCFNSVLFLRSSVWIYQYLVFMVRILCICAFKPPDVYCVGFRGFRAVLLTFAGSHTPSHQCVASSASLA